MIWEFTIGDYVFDSFLNKTYAMEGPSVLRSCGQIYAETALLPFKLATFCIGESDIFEWLCTRSEARRAMIRKLIFQISGAGGGVSSRPRKAAPHDIYT